MDYVLGVTCLNDVTARELQVKDVQYHARQGLRHLLRRSGPCIAVGLDPSNLTIEGWVNGETAPVVEHQPADLPGARSSSSIVTRFCTLAARRHHHDRHAVRRRSAHSPAIA